MSFKRVCDEARRVDALPSGLSAATRCVWAVDCSEGPLETLLPWWETRVAEGNLKLSSPSSVARIYVDLNGMVCCRPPACCLAECESLESEELMPQWEDQHWCKVIDRTA